MSAGIPLALVPLFPAIAYMFVVALLFGFYDGFTALTVWNLLALGGFVAASFIIDNLAGVVGAKYGGAHTRSLAWGLLGALIGTIVFPPLGSLIGLFLAVLLSEIGHKRDRSQAVRAASGAFVGALVGILVNVALAAAFLVTFILVALS